TDYRHPLRSTYAPATTIFDELRRRYHGNPLFFFNDTPPTAIYTLSLHDALPISSCHLPGHHAAQRARVARADRVDGHSGQHDQRSEEHTSELQSLAYLVCRLLLEKKNNIHSGGLCR